VVVAVRSAVLGNEFDVLGRLNGFPRVPVDEGDLTTGGIIALAVARSAGRGGGGRSRRHALPPQGRQGGTRSLTGPDGSARTRIGDKIDDTAQDTAGKVWKGVRQ
jgi:hypothetical protein